MMPRIALLVVLGWQAAALQNQNGTIEGIVSDVATNAPLYGVRVSLGPATDDAKPSGRPLFSTITDEAGRFRLSAPPANYAIQAQRDGYFGAPRNGISQDYASRRITLGPRQQISNVAIGLQPGGVITGQLLDQWGRPRAGMTVTAMRTNYDSGRRIFTVARTASTNDRGDFRLYWIAPGDYIISGGPQTSFTFPTTSPTQRLPARTFFPGTTDISSADSVTVPSSAETSGFNFTIQTIQTFSVNGRINNPYLAKGPEPAAGPATSFIAPPTMYLASRGTALDESFSSFGNGATAAERREGVFRFSGVLPGIYDLYVVANDGGPTLSPSFGGKVSVDVTTQDVSGIVVNVRPPVELKGRFVLNSTGPRVDFPGILLSPRGNVPGIARAATPPKVTPQTTGEFTISKIVLPTSYAIQFEVPDGLFLADMRQGQRSIYPDGGVVITGEPAEPLQIVLGRNGGIIRGHTDKAGPDTTIVLVPDTALRENALLYKTARPSADGTFEIKNIAPGNYKLFAWEGVLATAWMNADFLKRFEQRGMPIKVEQAEIKIEQPITPINLRN